MLEVMDQTELKSQIKRAILEELDLRGKTAADIDDAAPLFGAGLGLDSLDALQLAMAIEERFGVSVPEGEASRAIFASVNAIAEHVAQAKAK
ncbi:MAG TPA: phosphopantetheine-binding protein [Polyangiaceae bacterium]|jgi:acyl carrier protein|nr:phosphopantetheine-binding protein [Polyangiaceae bacterium]